MKISKELVIASMAAVPVWAALVAFQVSANFGFGAVGMFGLAAMGSVGAFLVAVLVGVVWKRWRAAFVCGFMVIAVFTSTSAASFISTRQREASIVSAGPIITALERFHAAKGSYPKSLEELIPEYLTSEPRTKVGFRGDRFIYSPDPDGFWLGIELPRWRVCSYDSKSREWRIHD